LGGAVAVASHYGGPTGIWRSFSAQPQKATNLNARLFTLSNNGRLQLWRVGANVWRAHPLAGAGAGTYRRAWVADRPIAMQVVNAHNLYVETLAETGIVGLVLLLAALAVPVVAAVRVRKHPLVAVAAGAYVAFLVHAFFDWDWQLPGVAVAPMLAGAAVVLACRQPRQAAVLSARARYGLMAALVLVAAAAGATLIGNRAASSAATATAQGTYGRAIADARHARMWQPWSSQPWQLLGTAQLQRGQLRLARASFRSAIAKNPQSWELWLDLALASEKPADRRAAAVRALALNPRSIEINRIRAALGLPPRR
jgi:Flp pilus assembly protein TadD